MSRDMSTVALSERPRHALVADRQSYAVVDLPPSFPPTKWGLLHPAHFLPPEYLVVQLRVVGLSS